MLDKLKKLIGYGERRSLSPEDSGISISAHEVKGSAEGSAIIAMTLNMLVDEMKSRFSEWDGLFDIKANNGHVVVSCLKGFEDKNTQNAIPCLWRRKSFIENCRLMGVSRIVFLDSIKQTFDLLKVEDVDIDDLP